MRTLTEYNKVIELHKKGINNLQISKITKIPRPTVVGWVNGKFDISKNKKNLDFNPIKHIKDNKLEKEYSYILGLYLGDGYIVKQSRTFKLRIFLDFKYEKLNNFAKQKLTKLFLQNKVYELVYKNKTTNQDSYIELSVHNNNLEILFPQSGIGKKHNRKIDILDWQNDIINYHYLLLGLFHSDGCYYLNKKQNKYYYSFSNMSLDIINIYQFCCDRINIKHFTTKSKIKTGVKYQVVVSGKKNVDEFKKLFSTKEEVNILL